MIFKLTIKDKQIKSQAWEHIKQLLDGEYLIEIKKWYNRRSVRQNSFWWSYLKIVSEYAGHTDNELHAYAKQHLIPLITVPKVVLDKEVYPESTTQLNKKEFSELMLLAEERFDVPIPATLKEEDYIN